MRVAEIINTQKKTPFSCILEQCNQFLVDTRTQPLLKNLPIQYNNIHKVKVRKRNVNNEFAELFNQAFDEQFNSITQRAIFANGLSSFVEDKNGTTEPFFIFPIDGYKYLYSSEVNNSSQDYKQVIDTMFEQFGSDKGKNIVSDLLKFTYKHDNLCEGIEKGCEIVLYDVPYYFAVRSKYVSNSYDLLLQDILQN